MRFLKILGWAAGALLVLAFALWVQLRAPL